MDFDEFWWISMSSDGFRWVLMDFDEFWWISMSSDEFWWVLMGFDEFWWIFDEFWWVSMSSDGFWWILMSSDGFLMDFDGSSLFDSEQSPTSWSLLHSLMLSFFLFENSTDSKFQKFSSKFPVHSAAVQQVEYLQDEAFCVSSGRDGKVCVIKSNLNEIEKKSEIFLIVFACRVVKFIHHSPSCFDSWSFRTWRLEVGSWQKYYWTLHRHSLGRRFSAPSYSTTTAPWPWSDTMMGWKFSRFELLIFALYFTRNFCIDWLSEGSIDWLIERVIDCLIDWRSIDWLIDWLMIHRLIDWLIDWSMARLIDWLINGSIDWLIDF